MDTDSHQADLNALSKLYGLVQINESGGQSLLTKILDEDSSIFLKKLLDSAAERIFEAHVEYMTDKWRSALYTKNLGQPQDPLEICNNALARVESLIPSLQDLSKPYSVALASSSGQTSGVRTSHHNQMQYNQRRYQEKHKPRRKTSSRGSSDLKESEKISSDSSGSSSWKSVEVSSSASSYDKATPTTTSKCSSGSASKFSQDYDIESSSKTQYGTSESRSAYDSSSSYNGSDRGDDESSAYEFNRSRHHSVQHRKMGKLSRLKNKLGLIFHHHHHHHHHSHDKKTEASGSKWKKYGKMFRNTEKRVEANIERKFKKMKAKKAEEKNEKRPASGKGKHKQKHKQQNGHFLELVSGIKRRSNKPKQEGRGGILDALNKPKQGGREKNHIKVNRKPRFK